MIFREAMIADIPQMQIVRNSVKENVLSNPTWITTSDYKTYLVEKGKGWVCEMEDQVVGFAIVDVRGNNVWALFVLPEYEGKGIGKRLHQLMLDWYFSETGITLWLGTAFGTRAEAFYRRQGWAAAGLHGSKEIKFEMTPENWETQKSINYR